MERPDILSTVRSALAHLDDPVYLEAHPLAREIPFLSQAPVVSRGQLLRRMLRLAIESLDPGPNVSSDSPEGQCYQVLYRYAIAKQSIISISMQLGMSERQAYRMLERGAQAIAEILLSAGEEASVVSEDTLSKPFAYLRDEVERLTVAGDQRFDICDLILEVRSVVLPLAEQRGITLECDLLPAGDHPIIANRVMLRQALINLFSYALQCHQGPHLKLELVESTGGVSLSFCYWPSDAEESANAQGPYVVAQQLLTSLEMPLKREELTNGWVRLILSMNIAPERTVLVIDDNEGLIALFRRYLQGEPYRVYGAKSVEESLAIIDELKPHIILLDIMMPGQDGWEGLQALREMDGGRRAKIIVCSIINDPDLSTALGADSFLHKPVKRYQLLKALSRVASSVT